MEESNRLIGSRYRLRQKVGQGAMGVVWQAYDEQLHRLVAAKELLVLDGLDEAKIERAKARAMREARLAARLEHPNAIRVYDVVEEDGQPWLIMEYLPSRSLAAVIAEQGTLPPREVARIGCYTAAALAAAHRHGIQHRDVKPGNVLIGDQEVKITDFGISRATDDGTATATGTVGTPAFFSPEVARGDDAGFPSDVFSLGATLYNAVEGAPPFGAADNHIAMLHRVASGSIMPPANAGPLLSPVLFRLLATDPERRPTMQEAVHLLAAVVNETPQVSEATAVIPATVELPVEAQPAEKAKQEKAKQEKSAEKAAAGAAAGAAAAGLVAAAAQAESAGLTAPAAQSGKDESADAEAGGAASAGTEAAGAEPAGTESAGAESVGDGSAGAGAVGAGSAGARSAVAGSAGAESAETESTGGKATGDEAVGTDTGTGTEESAEPKAASGAAGETVEDKAVEDNAADKAAPAGVTDGPGVAEKPTPAGTSGHSATGSATEGATEGAAEGAAASIPAAEQSSPTPDTPTRQAVTASGQGSTTSIPPAPIPTRPLPAAATPTSTASTPTYTPPPNSESEENRRKFPLVPIAIVIVVLAVGVGAFLLWPKGGNQSPSNNPAASGTSSPPATGQTQSQTQSQQPTDTQTQPQTNPQTNPQPNNSPSQAPPATPQTAEQALTAYYALIPGDLQTGYSLLTDNLKAARARTFQEYQTFWSQFTSVQLSGIAPQGENVVSATVTYMQGTSVYTTERHTYTLVRQNGKWMIDRQVAG